VSAVVRSEALHPVREGILLFRAEAGSVAVCRTGDGILPAAAWFGKDQLKPSFWRSTGLAVSLELALLAGLFAWVMAGHPAQYATKNPVTAVTLAVPLKPPRPLVRTSKLPIPNPSGLALAPVLPVLVPLPPIARRMGLSGRDEALVEFRLKPDGQLLWARIARSSGSGTVDRAALQAFRQTDFPPFIPRMVRVDTTFALWVHLNMHET